MLWDFIDLREGGNEFYRFGPIYLRARVLITLFLICLDVILIIMKEVLALSINPPFMYPLYVTIIMITLRRLLVPLVPHTPRLLIYHFFTDPPLPQSLYSSLSFIHLPI